jgi:hypothetical protein
VANGIVYFGSNDGGVYAIRVDAAQAMQRAVFWDADTAKLNSPDLAPQFQKFATARDFFQLHGYEVRLPGNLGDWINKRISDRAPSVIIFPTDTFPSTIGLADPAHGLLRQYLDSGGKVVCLGWPPLLLRLTVDKGTITGATMHWDDLEKLLGISFNGSLNNEFGDNQVTPAGRDWGFPDWWLGRWDMPLSSNITALSFDERGFAGAWVKNYGGAPGTGFVYAGISNWNTEILVRLAMVAEYRPR